LEPGKTPEMVARNLEVPVVKYLHRVAGGGTIEFDNRYESAGTQKLLAYVGPLLEAMDCGKLLVIDELDSSLHPMVTRFILRLIHDPHISTRNAQLWITTHDTALLDTEILRRDQVWFVEKDEHQASHVYPLSDFSPRRNEALERGYLRGRYGALPFISSPNLH
jgi:AAA15 family ATPase/GTPase